MGMSTDRQANAYVAAVHCFFFPRIVEVIFSPSRPQCRRRDTTSSHSTNQGRFNKGLKRTSLRKFPPGGVLRLDRRLNVLRIYKFRYCQCWLQRSLTTLRVAGKFDPYLPSDTLRIF